MEDFKPGGPLLPIEFCRVSGGGRLTLVIDEAFGASCQTYVAESACGDLDAALKNLWIREGSQGEALPRNVRTHGRVGFVEVASGDCSARALERHPKAVATIKTWAQANGFDAAIWTALARNFDQSDNAGEPFSANAAIRYLEGMYAPKLTRPLPTSGLRLPKCRRMFGLRSVPDGRKDEPTTWSGTGAWPTLHFSRQPMLSRLPDVSARPWNCRPDPRECESSISVPLSNATGIEVLSSGWKITIISDTCKLFTKSAQSSGPENIGPERPLSSLRLLGPVLSPSRITLEYNGKIRPQPDRENVSQGQVAEPKGFEPSRRFPVCTLSRGVPSTTRPQLRLPV